MEPPASFSDLPVDVQMAVISFLSHDEISAVACTSRHFRSLCNPKSACSRRWGSKTLIPRWTSNFPLLYKTLDRLIGFWRRIGSPKKPQKPPPPPPLVASSGARRAPPGPNEPVNYGVAGWGCDAGLNEEWQLRQARRVKAAPSWRYTIVAMERWKM